MGGYESSSSYTPQTGSSTVHCVHGRLRQPACAAACIAFRGTAAGINRPPCSAPGGACPLTSHIMADDQGVCWEGMQARVWQKYSAFEAVKECQRRESRQRTSAQRGKHMRWSERASIPRAIHICIVYFQHELAVERRDEAFRSRLLLDQENNLETRPPVCSRHDGARARGAARELQGERAGERTGADEALWTPVPVSCCTLCEASVEEARRGSSAQAEALSILAECVLWESQ